MINKSATYKSRIIILVAFITFSLTSSEIFSQQKTVYFDTSMYHSLPEGLNINLRIAAANNYVNEIYRLAKMGADINDQDNLGLTALTYAVANSNNNSVIALLTFDIETDLFTYEGETNIHIATKLNSVDVCEYLIRKGADIDIEDRNKCTALHYASIYNYLYLTDLLLYYGADPNKKSSDGTTALSSAVWSGNAEIVDLLIQAGADISLADENGFTPLLVAAQNGDTLITKMLIDAGARISDKNKSNFDAASIAARTGDTEYASYLLNKTDWEKKHDQSAANPLSVARDYGKNQFFKFWSQNSNSKTSRLSLTVLKASASLKFCAHDVYTGFDLSLIDPLYKLRLNIGFDLKPWNTRVLYKESDELYYQYRDQRYLFVAGLGKEFVLLDNIFRGRNSIVLNMNMAYLMSESYKGTYIKPTDKILFLPAIGYERTINNITFGLSYEYMKTGLYKAGPNWIKLSAGYNFQLKKKKSSSKRINWY